MSGGVLVLGAGPAGLAAAATLARRGLTVTLVDRYDRSGGQIARQPRSATAPTGPWAGLLGAVDHPAVDLLASTSVVALQRRSEGGVRAILSVAGHLVTRDAAAVVLATGSREVVAPFPGWTLPGVVTAGAVQALVKREGRAPWRRIGLAGSGPLLLAVAEALRQAGQPPAFTLEAQPLRHLARAGAVTGIAFPAKSAQLAGLLARERPRFGWVVLEAVGASRGDGPAPGAHRGGGPAVGAHPGGGPAVGAHRGDGPALVAAVIARRDGRGAPRTVALDALAVSSRLVPDVVLGLQLGCATTASADGVATAVVVDADQRTSVPGVYAAGEMTGVGGAEKSVAEGRLAGESVAATLAGTAGAGAGLRAEVARWRRFASDLEVLYPFDHAWADQVAEEVVVCRCEEVTAGTVRRAVADGAHTARAVKGLTRAGMGWCQGGVCSPLVRSALRAAGHDAAGDLESRPLATPVTLAELARLGQH